MLTFRKTLSPLPSRSCRSPFAAPITLPPVVTALTSFVLMSRSIVSLDMPSLFAAGATGMSCGSSSSRVISFSLVDAWIRDKRILGRTIQANRRFVHSPFLRPSMSYRASFCNFCNEPLVTVFGSPKDRRENSRINRTARAVNRSVSKNAESNLISEIQGRSELH